MNNPFRIMLVSVLLCLCCSSAFAQPNAFTYQGKLTDGGTAPNGTVLYEMQFKLFDASSGGQQLPQPNPVTLFFTVGNGNPVSVVNGFFTVSLDFRGGGVFLGAGDRFLEISVRRNSSEAFTLLSPRQQVNATPYALRSLTADSVSVLGVPEGSGNYIQNTTSTQASSNFNIEGNGTAGGTLSGNVVNATTQFNLNGSRVLSGSGNNLSVGVNSGSGGGNNTFVGVRAGARNFSGTFNTMLGYGADLPFNAAVTNATAIGSKAFVSQSNSLVLGAYRGNGLCLEADGCDSVNVGIGTTAPGFRLDVVGRIRLKQNLGDTGNINTAGLWLFENTPNTERAFIGMMDDNYVGLYGNNGTNWGLVMHTQNGRVGIGTTSPDQTLTVGVGTASKPGGGSWATLSDERLKNIKGSFTPGLKALMQLHPIRYEYKPNNALSIKSEGEAIGFSAQAVQKIIPEAVITNDKGYLLINNDPIIWTMLNAIKEQQAQIERQQREINALKRVLRSRKTHRAIAKQN